MVSSPRHSRWFDDPLIRWIIGVAIALTLLGVAIWLFTSPGQVTVVFTWFIPAIYSFRVLAASAIAFLCLGRYLVLPQPAPFWLGIAFSTWAILSVFFILTFPGLVSDQEGLITANPNTSAMLSLLTSALLVTLFQVAVLARWPRAGGVGERWGLRLWLAIMVIVIVITSLSIAFEGFLPLLESGGTLTPLLVAEFYVAGLVAIAGTVLAVYRYRQTGNSLFAYLALTEFLYAFNILFVAFGYVRYSLSWYIGSLLVIPALTIMLFGLLSEYVGLYRRERQKTRELEALQQVTDPSIARLELKPLLKSLLERTVAIMGAHAGTILLLDPDRKELVVRSAVGIPEDQAIGWSVKVGEDFAGRVVTLGAPLWVRDAQTDPSVTSPYIKDNNIRGIIGVPMTIEGDVIGVVHVDFLEPRDFGRQEEQLLEVVAERAALAIYQERLLEEAQGRAAELDATITSIADGVLIYSPTGEIVRINQAAERILRYSKKEREMPLTERLRILRMETTTGKPLVPEETPPTRALRGETIQGCEIAIHRPPDRTIWLSFSAAPIRLPDDEQLGAVITFTDISERKRAELERERLLEEVQQERNRLQVVLDTAPVGIAFYSAPDGRLQLANKAFEVILGRPSVPGALATDQAARYGIHLPSGEPFPPEQLPVSRSLRGETIIGVEEFIRQPSGRGAFIQVNSAPLLDAEGKIIGAIAAFQDITPIKEQELLRDEFISAAAHELKTPVTTIKGYAQLMRQWTPQERLARDSQALDVINTQTDRINRRVQEMLEAVRFRKAPPELRPVRFDLGELVYEVVRRVQQMAQLHKISLQRDRAAPVDADRERIEEVLVSLLDNAIKYSPKASDIEVRVWTDKGEALVAVKDHGVGISRERQRHIFEPFYEAVPAGAPGYHGVVALSLYLSRLIIERHKGRIWFESEVGKGSTFYFALPLAKGGGSDKAA